MTEITLTASNATLLIPTGATQSTSFQDTCKVNHLWRLALGTLHLHQTLSCNYVREIGRLIEGENMELRGRHISRDNRGLAPLLVLDGGGSGGLLRASRSLSPGGRGR